MMQDKRGHSLPDYLSSVVSILFHPVFLPVYGMLIIFNAPTFMVHLPFSVKRIIFMLATVNMSVVPLALMPFLRFRNVISSYSMDTTKERVIPLSLGVLMYLVTTLIFYSYEIPYLIKSFMMAASVTSVIVLIITFRWKISIHSTGAGGLLATVIALSLRMDAPLRMLIAALILVAGIVMTSRLHLKSHKPSQVYIGFLVGFIVFFLIMMLL